MADQTNLPNADDWYKSSQQGGLPSADDWYKQATEPSTLEKIGSTALHSLPYAVAGPIAGPIADAYFNGGPVNRIAKAFGQSFEQSYGHGTPSPETEEFLRKNGIWNDYTKDQNDVFKGLAESFGRPIIKATDAALAGVQATGAAIEQLGTEGTDLAKAIQPYSNTIATVVGGTSEVIGATPSGFLPELHVPHLPPVDHLSIDTARANGVIGESEANFFGTKPLTPEQTAARAEATIHAKPTIVPDVHTIARQIAPEVFDEYDIIDNLRNWLRRKIGEQSTAQPVNPYAQKLQENIDTILSKVGGDEDRLTNTAAERLRKSRTALEETPLKTDTPEMADLRRQLQETDYRIRDLAPDVATAYRRAGEQTGDLLRGSTEETETASPETSINPIEDTIKKQLTDLGRPEEEATAQAALVKAYYDTRGSRTGRTAKEVFDAEHPEVRAATEVEELASKGRIKGKLALGQARNTLILFKTADGSTFVHEMGHQFLENLRKDALDPKAAAQTAIDSAIVHTWLKASEDKPLTKKQHEQFARGFERYLMEGRAPTKELASVFQKFKTWLQKIYNTVSKLRSPITDDIRDVFHRLLSEDPDYNGVTIAPEEVVNPEPLAGDMFAPINDLKESKPVETVADSNSIISYNQSDYISKDGKINFDKITSDESLQNFMRAFAEQNNNYIKSRKIGFTAAERIEQAEAFGTTTRNMERNVEKLRKLTVDATVSLPVRVEALKTYVEQNARIARDAALNGNTYEVANATLRFLNIQRTMSGVETTWGHLGQALKKAKVAVEQERLISELMQNSIGRSLEDVEKDAARIRELDTPAKINAYMNVMTRPSLGEMLEELYQSFLISGPITHMSYLIGNKIFSLYKAGPEALVTAAIGKAEELITGKSVERVTMGEVKAGLYAILYGQREGLKAMKESFLTGENVTLPGEDLSGTPFTRTKRIPGIVGSIIRAPGERMVNPIHSADRVVNYQVKKAQLDYRKTLSEFPDDQSIEFKNRMAELANNPDSDIVKQSRDYATDTALMGPSGNWTKRVQNVLRIKINLPLLGRIHPLIFPDPFVHVSGNINRMLLLERTPLGLATKAFKADMAGEHGPIARHEAIAKMFVGSAFGAAVAGGVLMKQFTPGPPEDWKEANIRKMSEGLPHSVRIGEMSYALDRLGVLGGMFSVYTDIVNAAQHGVEDDSWTEGLLMTKQALWNHLKNEGFMSGISEMFTAIDDDKKGLQWVKNFGANLTVPIGVGQMAQRIDPYQRQINGFTDMLRSKIPYISEDLFPKIDIFGQPTPNREFWGVYAQQVHDDPVVAALEATHTFPAPVKKDIKGVALTPEQYNQYATLAGVTLRQSLERLITQPGWSEMPVSIRHDQISNAVSSSRSTAQGIIQAKYWGTSETDIARKAYKLKESLVKP